MGGLAASGATARAHAPLVQRAAAILGSAIGNSSPAMRSKGEAAAPGPGPNVMLERGPLSALRREGPRGHFALTYRYPASDSALASLVAVLTPPGMPIAADPESLSGGEARR